MPNYDFRNLSPLDFEDLVRDLLQAEEGVRLESFGPGADQGVDFRFASGNGAVVVQAKHYTGAFSALVAAARKEDPKVRRLQPARYIFATSASLNDTRKGRLMAALPSAPLVSGDVLGREDLNNLLGCHPAIEKRHLKLWLSSTAVLERIVHSRLYNRSDSELDAINRALPRFVTNESVPKALEILEDQGTLIISGEPGVGKSTLAQMLVWSHARDDWRVTVVDDIADVFTLEDGSEPHLVFFDDFLGQIELTPDWIRRVDQRLPPFLRKARTAENLRFIMTTRDYILKSAQERSDRLSGADLKLTEFVLDVGSYTRAVKARMLFNHIYFSDLDPVDRAALLADDFYLEVIGHKNYNPRIVSLMTSKDYRSLDGEADIRTAFIKVLNDPAVLWEKPYRSHITDDGRALLLALLFNRRLVGLGPLEKTFARVCQAQGRPTNNLDRTQRLRTTLRSLEGSMIAVENRMVRFGNPGVRDFLRGAVLADRQLLPLAEQLGSFDEVSAAWEIWPGSDTPSAAERHSWTIAAGAMIDDDSGSDLDQLALLMSMRSLLNAPDADELIGRQLDMLEPRETEEEEWEQLEVLLEEVAAIEDRTEVEQRVWEVLTYRGATLLDAHGSSLNLDAIESMGLALCEHGCDDSVCREAVQSALRSYIDTLSETLSDIHDYSQLQQLAAQLEGAMSAWDVHDHHVDMRIESRRGDLEGASPGGYGGGGWRPPSGPPAISDDGIRSMFSVLR